jgi:hypothetical protein
LESVRLQVLHGTLGENVIEHIAVVASEVALPILMHSAHAGNWPEAVVSDLRENLGRFVADGAAWAHRLVVEGVESGRSSFIRQT